MRLLRDVYLVGSGYFGVGMSNRYDCHCYLIDGGDGQLALIDAGVGIEPEAIVSNIKADGFDPAAIKYLVLTHAHADHSGGAWYWKEVSGCHVLVGEAEAGALESGDESAISLDVARRAGYYPPDYQMKACPVTRALRDGDEIAIGRYHLRVLATPGHSPGSIALLGDIGPTRVLFSGDTVFYGGLISLQNIPGCDLHAYARSVLRLENLGVDALLPGHLLFVVCGGQAHVDAAAQAFRGLGVPKSMV